MDFFADVQTTFLCVDLVRIFSVFALSELTTNAVAGGGGGDLKGTYQDLKCTY